MSFIKLFLPNHKLIALSIDQIFVTKAVPRAAADFVRQLKRLEENRAMQKIALVVSSKL